jgi:hypothetical protein
MICGSKEFRLQVLNAILNPSQLTFRSNWIAIQLINKCNFENSRNPYLYISHNGLHIKLRWHFNVFLFII